MKINFFENKTHSEKINSSTKWTTACIYFIEFLWELLHILRLIPLFGYTLYLIYVSYYLRQGGHFFSADMSNTIHQFIHIHFWYFEGLSNDQGHNAVMGSKNIMTYIAR